ncbi:hypothetical protein POG22_12055 [Geitlerinema sp. CS-897]|nr:hypothetical protein [Geitlerinema sp. CS-897]
MLDIQGETKLSSRVRRVRDDTICGTIPGGVCGGLASHLSLEGGRSMSRVLKNWMLKKPLLKRLSAIALSLETLETHQKHRERSNRRPHTLPIV